VTQPPGPGPEDEPPNPHGRPPTFGPPPGYTGPPPGQSAPPPGYGGPPPGYYPPGQYGPPPGYYPPGQYGPPPQYGAPPQYGPPPGYGPPNYPPYFSVPRPGCVPLRPLGLGDILDGAFKVMRRNPKTTLGLSAGVALIEAVIGSIALYVALHTLRHQLHGLETGRTSGGFSFNTDPTQLVGNTLSIFMSAILSGLLTIVVTQDVLGRRLTIAQAWEHARPRIWRLLGLVITTTILSVIGLVLCLAPGIWLWGIWAVAIPACMVEGLGVGASLGRSKRLVDGTFWRVWGIRALGYLITTIASSLLAAPFLIGGFLGIWHDFDNGGAQLLFVILFGVGSLVSRTFTAPIQAGIDALLYVDLRMRKEGLDIALQHAAAAPATAPPARPLAAD
jgi:hypothetical protein